MGTGLAVLAAVLVCASAITGYVHRAVLNPEQFANRAVASLDEPAVREFLGARIAEAAVQQAPDLVAVQPLIRGAATSVTGRAPFRSIFRSAVRDVHRTVLEQDRDTVLLTLPDVGLVVRGALARRRGAAGTHRAACRARQGPGPDRRSAGSRGGARAVGRRPGRPAHRAAAAGPRRRDPCRRRCVADPAGRAPRAGAARVELPNIVAVDFYRQGDVFGAVDTLNGVGGAPAGAR